MKMNMLTEGKRHMMTEHDGSHRLVRSAERNGLSTPSVCDRCHVAALPERGPVVPTRPRLRFDSYGEHALTCNRSSATTKRHNAMAYALMRCARRAGSEPQVENRAIMDGGWLRPGDVYLSRWPGKTSGLAIDVTVVSKWVRTTEKAEEGKREKYKSYFADYDTLGFAPFAIDLGGGMGQEAWRVITELGRLTALQPENNVTQSEAVRDIVSELAWTFVDEVSKQVERRMRGRGGTVNR